MLTLQSRRAARHPDHITGAPPGLETLRDHLCAGLREEGYGKVNRYNHVFKQISSFLNR
jgi:hypothetical protein